MRALFVTSPGIGHVFPTVSLAHALRASGHDVLYALGGEVPAAAGAGMAAVNTAPGVDFRDIFRAVTGSNPRPPDGDGVGQWVARLFARVSEPTIDATMEVATAWRPDLVVCTPLQGAGPLVAAKLGTPVVEHALGLADTSTIRGMLRRELSAFYEKYAAPARPPREVSLNVAPPSMTPPVADDPEAIAWRMRYVPYNGGGVLPDWLWADPGRPRVAVTLGTAVPHIAGLRGLSPLIAAAGDADVEVVLALGEIDTSELGELPPNVRLCREWIPLGSLLSTCAGLIHHGGAGTTLTALDAGIPQLIAPHAADQHLNAEAVRARGAGRTIGLDAITLEDITTLATGEAMRTAAAEVAAEIVAMPPPSEVAQWLVELVSGSGTPELSPAQAAYPAPHEGT